MKCIRATNVQAIPILQTIIMDDPDFEKDWFLRQIAAGLLNNYQGLYVALLFNDEETECVGYAVAEAPAGARYVHIHQTWVKPEVGRRGADIFFERMVSWCRSIGRREVRAVTKRSTEVLERRHGFRVLSHNISYTIDDPAQDFLLPATEGVEDGRRQSSDHERTGGGTETNRSSDLPVPDGAGSRSEGPQASEDGRGVSGLGSDASVQQDRDSVHSRATDASGSNGSSEPRSSDAEKRGDGPTSAADAAADDDAVWRSESTDVPAVSSGQSEEPDVGTAEPKLHPGERPFEL